MSNESTVNAVKVEFSHRGEFSFPPLDPPSSRPLSQQVKITQSPAAFTSERDN